MFTHCFNHHLELSVKDAFNGAFIDKIAVRLRTICYKTIYYKNIIKTIIKPSKSTGTLWIAHKDRAIEKILVNYIIYMAHIVSFSQADSQALKRIKIKKKKKK